CRTALLGRQNQVEMTARKGRPTVQNQKRLSPMTTAAMNTTAGTLNARVPGGPIEQKWERCKNEMKLVSPTNKRKYDIIVVGTGLAGAAAAASLGELGYNVKAFCFQ